MKYLAFSFMFILMGQVKAQNNMLSTKSTPYVIKGNASFHDISVPAVDNFDFTKDVKLISVNNGNPYLQRSYMINKKGDTVSSGFIQTSYFLPNNNFILVSGKSTMNRDSFNPYGSSDLPSAIIIGTLNSFISGWTKKKR